VGEKCTPGRHYTAHMTGRGDLTPTDLHGGESGAAVLPDDVTLVDLRPQELRWADPLDRWFGRPAVVTTLERIERGDHGLGGRLLIVCEIGQRSRLAAMYLRADGVEATSLPGGVRGLKLSARARGG